MSTWQTIQQQQQQLKESELTGAALSNLIWNSMESVANEAGKCSAYLEKRDKGLSSPDGLTQQAALKMYREKLAAALAAVDEAIA